MEMAFKMRKRLCALLSVFIFFLIFTTPILAKSSYVLPYPSYMPGSSLYKPHLLLAELSKFWYFGNFGKFTYNLKQADKYLVEAKTLFEYGQYLLGYRALKKSDEYFIKTLPSLKNAKSEGKDISQNMGILTSAAQKHAEVLTEIKKAVPDKFNWQPEKSASTMLDLKSTIESSIVLRRKYL